MKENDELGLSVRSMNPETFFDRMLNAASLHHGIIALAIICLSAAALGGFAIYDLRQTDRNTQEAFSRSVNDWQQFGQLQYDAQETRRATFYALTTSDSNRQIEYADQSRQADEQVRTAIQRYEADAKQPAEVMLGVQLKRDWNNYASVRTEVLALILEGSTNEAVTLDLAKGLPAFDRVRQDLVGVRRFYRDDALRRQQELAASSHRSVSRLIGALCFSFLLSTMAIWGIQRSRMLGAIQLARLQMDFVASVSHELRTPLGVLMSAADNLADGLINDRIALERYGSILRHQTRNMGNLVDQILLFASTEDNKTPYALEALEVRHLIHSVTSSTEQELKESGAILDVRVDPDLPLVLGSRAGISQCLRNLISNAAKYGNAGGRVVLHAALAPAGASPGGEVRVSVEDHGMGIDSSELPHIFDPFFRSARVRAAQIHGTGLGLSLAKRVAESMGGRVSVRSELSVGSTFTLHLQIAKGEGELRGV